MKSVTRVKMNGKTYLTTKKCYESMGHNHFVEDDVYAAVRYHDKLGKFYEEKPDKELSAFSEDVLFSACELILSGKHKRLNYRDVMDTLYLLIYTMKEWETKE